MVPMHWAVSNRANDPAMETEPAADVASLGLVDLTPDRLKRATDVWEEKEGEEQAGIGLPVPRRYHLLLPENRPQIAVLLAAGTKEIDYCLGDRGQECLVRFGYSHSLSPIALDATSLTLRS